MDATPAGALPSISSPGSRTVTPTMAVRPRPRIPTTLTSASTSKPEDDETIHFFKHHHHPLYYHHHHHHPHHEEDQPQGRSELQQPDNSNTCGDAPNKLPAANAIDNFRKQNRHLPERGKAGSVSTIEDQSSNTSPCVASSTPPVSLSASVISHGKNPASSTSHFSLVPETGKISVTSRLCDEVKMTQAPLDQFTETRLNDAIGLSDNGDVISGEAVGQCSFEARKASSQPVARAASLVFRKHTPPSSDLLASTTTRRPVPPAAALSNDRQTPWETESLGSPVDAWDRFAPADDGNSSRPNSENSVRRPEEGLKDCAVESRAMDEAMAMKRPGFGGGGVGAPVVRSFSLRKLKKLDRIVTCDILQGTISNGGSRRHSPTITAESSTSKIEDEGVGALDIDDGGHLYTRSLDPDCSISFSKTPDNLNRSFETAGSSRCGAVSGNLTGNNAEDEVSRQSARFSDPSSPSLKNPTSSRFLTHPPIRDRSLTREGGSMDSNGLGALRDMNAGSQVESAMTQASLSSLDSHICPSEDASERVSCPSEVALDKEEEGGGGVLGRLEYKSSKTLKQKSKSDPSGDKNNESVDLSSSLATIGIYTQSSPILIEKQNNVRFSFGGQEEQADRSDPDGRHSFDESLITEDSVVSPTREDAEVKVALQNEDSFDEQVPTVIKPPRPSTLSKRRPRAAFSAAFEPSDLKRKLVAIDSAKQGRSSEGDSTPTNDVFESVTSRSPAVVGRGKPTLPSSLTLPLLKKASILRSQSSVEAVDKHNEPRQAPPPPLSPTPPDIQSPTEESPSVGVRVRHGSGAPEYHLTAAGSALKIIGGSVQELYRSASPRLKSRTASSTSTSFSPSLDTILAQSALRLFEGASEEKVSQYYLLSCYHFHMHCSILVRHCISCRPDPSGFPLLFSPILSAPLLSSLYLTSSLVSSPLSCPVQPYRPHPICNLLFPCPTMGWHVLHVLYYLILSCSTMCCHVLLILLYCVLSSAAYLYVVLPCPFLLFRGLFNHVLFCPLLSCPHNV